MSPAVEPRYFNRELSWLAFNQRVLEEAQDPDVPLLERLKFLAITSSNLDEFFMVRVGGLSALAEAGRRKKDPAGLTPSAQLKEISRRTHEMVALQYECYRDALEPQCASHGITRIRREELTKDHLLYLEQFFMEQIYPVLTPMGIHKEQGFPLVKDLSLHVIARLKPEEGSKDSRIAVIPIELGLDRFVRLPVPGRHAYVLVEDVVCLFCDRFFAGQTLLECVPFRITRNADLGVREDEAPDLLAGMQEVLIARKSSDCVRLEISEGVTRKTLQMLTDALGVPEAGVYAVDGPLDLKFCMTLGSLEGFDELTYEPWPPRNVCGIDPVHSIFDQMKQKPYLLIHPFEEFDPVVRLVEEAAEDEGVIAIKQVLYRTSRRSPIVAALMKAARNGKYVTVIVELKARFDEARNIEQAQALEREGAQVIYGIRGLKTHAKCCLVLRRESDGIRRYMHFGTGNYNESTALLYSDVSYLTCDEDLGNEAAVFFNTIAGFSEPPRFRIIEAAPLGLRDRLVELIDGEAERKKQGQEASIMAKINSLVDPAIIDALYRASDAGVKVRMNIRGICCLRPGVPGLSENITVTSIVDRFLEHSRIFYFHHGGSELTFISSADWMTRNLDRRIELLVPIHDRAGKRRLVEVMDTYFKDTVKARRLMPDGTYERVRAGGRKKRLRSQEVLYDTAAERARRAESARQKMFEPHRPQEAG